MTAGIFTKKAALVNKAAFSDNLKGVKGTGAISSLSLREVPRGEETGE